MININEHKVVDHIYKFTPKELRQIEASQFEDKTAIYCGNYVIHIECGDFGKAMCTWIESAKNFKALDCTPGCGTPYYIDDFKHR